MLSSKKNVRESTIKEEKRKQKNRNGKKVKKN